MAPLPPREQRYPFLKYQGLEYSDANIADFKERIVMEHRDDAGIVIFTSRACGRLFDTREPLVRSSFWIRWSQETIELEGVYSGIRITYQEEMESSGFARGLDVRSGNIPYLLARYLRRFDAGKKSGALISGGQFVPAGPARQEGDAGGVTEDAPVAPGGGDKDEEIPQAVPPPPTTQGKKVAQLEQEVHVIMESLVKKKQKGSKLLELNRRHLNDISFLQPIRHILEEVKHISA
ncbi:hypothetical protein Tco_0730710 [Tanacetum coccineum]